MSGKNWNTASGLLFDRLVYTVTQGYEEARSRAARTGM